ncbi:hypothetical protein CDD83_3338 [Cordyceps sp. RAO-2017]|nr:hypothetical protein CDD83_3338 [Cordyceps sp. RAO-2017]
MIHTASTGESTSGPGEPFISYMRQYQAPPVSRTPGGNRKVRSDHPQISYGLGTRPLLLSIRSDPQAHNGRANGQWASDCYHGGQRRHLVWPNKAKLVRPRRLAIRAIGSMADPAAEAFRSGLTYGEIRTGIIAQHAAKKKVPGTTSSGPAEPSKQPMDAPPWKRADLGVRLVGAPGVGVANIVNHIIAHITQATSVDRLSVILGDIRNSLSSILTIRSPPGSRCQCPSTRIEAPFPAASFPCSGCKY